jgi:hypothetical protein
MQPLNHALTVGENDSLGYYAAAAISVDILVSKDPERSNA